MSLETVFKESKSVIAAIVIIVTATIGAISYFAKASDLNDLKQDYYQNKAYNRMMYLDNRINDLEARYRCYREECRDIMPQDLYREYLEKLKEREYTEKILSAPGEK
jgi:hypothetical protein